MEHVYEMPRFGQVFQQIHDNGKQVVFGRADGLDIKKDAEGNIVAWRCAIISGVKNAFIISHGQRWRVPSEWHPAPTDHEGQRPENALALLTEGIEHLRVQVAEIRDALGEVATESDVSARVAEVTERLDVLEGQVADLAAPPPEKTDLLAGEPDPGTRPPLARTTAPPPRGRPAKKKE